MCVHIYPNLTVPEKEADQSVHTLLLSGAHSKCNPLCKLQYIVFIIVGYTPSSPFYGKGLKLSVYRDLWAKDDNYIFRLFDSL